MKTNCLREAIGHFYAGHENRYVHSFGSFIPPYGNVSCFRKDDSVHLIATIPSSDQYQHVSNFTKLIV